jgi:O-antigen/teichoic acid export membrane protein
VYELSAIPSWRRILHRTVLLSGGVAIGQLAVLLSTPIITRFCEPEAFGQFAIAYTAIVLLGVAGLAQLEPDIPLCGEDELPIALVTQILIGCFSLSVFAIVIVVVSSTMAASSAFPSWVWPLLVLSGCLQLALLPPGYLFVRRGLFRLLALQRMNRLLGQALAQPAAAWGDLGAAGLLLGFVVGQLVALATGFGRILGEYRRIRLAHLRAIGAYLKRARSYPLHLLPANLLASAAQNLPAVVVASSFSVAESGLVVLVQRIVTLPVRLVSHTASHALLGELRDAAPDRRLRLGLQAFVLFTILGLGATGLALLPGTRGWSMLLGPGWERVWTTLLALAPLQTVFFAHEAMKNFFLLKGSDLLLVESALSVVTTLVVLSAPLVVTVDFETCLFAYSVAASTVYLSFLYVLFRRLRAEQIASVAGSIAPKR